MSYSHCKPGGWLLDLLDKTSVNVNTGYYNQQPVYYTQPIYYSQPVYYRQTPPQLYYAPVPVYYYYPVDNNAHSRHNCRYYKY